MSRKGPSSEASPRSTTTRARQFASRMKPAARGRAPAVSRPSPRTTTTSAMATWSAASSVGHSGRAEDARTHSAPPSTTDHAVQDHATRQPRVPHDGLGGDGRIRPPRQLHEHPGRGPATQGEPPERPDQVVAHGAAEASGHPFDHFLPLPCHPATSVTGTRPLIATRGIRSACTGPATQTFRSQSGPCRDKPVVLLRHPAEVVHERRGGDLDATVLPERLCDLPHQLVHRVRPQGLAGHVPRPGPPKSNMSASFNFGP